MRIFCVRCDLLVSDPREGHVAFSAPDRRIPELETPPKVKRAKSENPFASSSRPEAALEDDLGAQDSGLGVQTSTIKNPKGKALQSWKEKYPPKDLGATCPSRTHETRDMPRIDVLPHC